MVPPSGPEELLAEFSGIETPFNTSPPYIQLLILIAFNTAIFLGSAMIQKAFQVDILPIVCSMTGAAPVDPPAARPAGGTPPPSTNPFAAFTQNF